MFPPAPSRILLRANTSATMARELMTVGTPPAKSSLQTFLVTAFSFSLNMQSFLKK